MVVKHHFQYKDRKQCSSFTVYTSIKAEAANYCMSTMDCSLSNLHTHRLHFLPGLQSAFPEDTEDVVSLPTLPPSPSLFVFPSRSAHGNNTVGSQFFCTSVSSWWTKGGPACVCLRWVPLITPTLCSISWIVRIPSLLSKKRKLSQFTAHFKAFVLLSKQPQAFTVLFTSLAPRQRLSWWNIKAGMEMGKTCVQLQDWLTLGVLMFFCFFFISTHHQVGVVFIYPD